MCTQVWGNNLKSLYTGPILYTPYVPATLYVVAVNHIAVNGVKVTATASNDSATVTVGMYRDACVHASVRPPQHVCVCASVRPPQHVCIVYYY